MPNDPEERLRSLTYRSSPGLAPVELIRTRGEQRRQRGRAVIAGAAALVLLAGAGTAVALADRGDHDALVPTGPSASTSPSRSAETRDLAALLPQPDDASEIEGESWQPVSAVDDNPYARVQICASADVHGERGLARSLVRSAGATPGNGDRVFAQVLEYGSQDAAAGALAAVVNDVSRCPMRPDDRASGNASVGFTAFPLTSGAVGVEQINYHCVSGDVCMGKVLYWAVVGADRYVGYLYVWRDGRASQERLQEWADALKARLASHAETTPTPAASSDADGVLSPDDKLQLDRIGPVVVGMTLEQARAAAKQELRQQGDLIGNCVFYAPRSRRPDISFMVIHGIVSRVDVDQGSSTTTADGIGIGASEADVKRTYPATQVLPHTYTQGHYLRVLSHDGKAAFLFETDGTKVVNFRSGFPTAVDAPEGCA